MEERKQLRSFGFIVGGIFAIIGLWPVVFHSEDPRLWAVIPSAALIGLALILPQSLKLVFRVWMIIGHGLAWFNTRVILTFGFYGLFTPMGGIMRLMGKDPMRRSFDSGAQTYRVLREDGHRSHMNRQY